MKLRSRKFLWQPFTFVCLLSLLVLLCLIAFFFGKEIGPDDEGNSNGLYWLHWRIGESSAITSESTCSDIWSSVFLVSKFVANTL